MTYEVKGCGSVELGPRWQIVNEWGETAGPPTDNYDSAIETAQELNR